MTDQNKDRGERGGFDPVSGEVSGSGSGAGGGNPGEDYDQDSKAGSGDEPPGAARPIDEATTKPRYRHGENYA